MMKETLEFDFLGEKIQLLSDENSSHFTSEAMEIAKRYLQEAQAKAKVGAPHRIALLALLELSGDHVKSRKKMAQLKKEIHEKIQSIKSHINLRSNA